MPSSSKAPGMSSAPSRRRTSASQPSQAALPLSPSPSPPPIPPAQAIAGQPDESLIWTRRGAYAAVISTWFGFFGLIIAAVALVLGIYAFLLDQDVRKSTLI